MVGKDFNSVEDFLTDPSFRGWVLEGKHSADWEKWYADHPERRFFVNEARAIVNALAVHHQQLTTEELDAEVKKIMDLVTKPDSGDRPSSVKPIRLFRRIATIAASIALLIVTSVVIIYFTRQKEPVVAMYEMPSGNSSTTALEQVNHSDTVQLMHLPDGSKVYLSRSSKITFNQISNHQAREVHLTGEAFFQVVKDPAKPFFVHTKNLVTKVLGTSFRVIAYDSMKKSSVIVSTGKVSVYKKDQFEQKDINANKPGGYIITPNQEIVYDLARNEISKMIVERPVMINPDSLHSMTFEAAPVREVFKVLENIYGLSIMYDEETLSSCTLSATFGNEGFYEKIDLICKALNATYEILDGNIFITSSGCK